MTKEEVDEIMKIPGNVRGAILQTHAVYIEHKKGREGVKMLEEKLKELENSGSIETKPEDPEVLLSIEINVKQLEENLTFELDYWVNINKYAQRMQGLIDDVQIQTCYNNILLSKKQILSLLKENINSF